MDDGFRGVVGFIHLDGTGNQRLINGDSPFKSLGGHLVDFFGDTGALCVHGNEHPVNPDAGIQPRPGPPDGVDQQFQAFGGEKLRGGGDKHTVVGGQGVDGQQPQRGRAVDDDVIVPGAQRGKDLL